MKLKYTLPIKKSLCILFSCSLLFFPSNVYAKVIEPTIKITKNITYANTTTKHPERLKLDVYTNNSQKKKPLIIYIHGGAWHKGDKTQVYAKPTHLLNSGYSFASINYRMAPEVTYDKMAKDVATGIKYLFDHHKKYNFDKNRVILMGHSAGAHLVTLLSTDDAYLLSVGLHPRDFKATVALDGFYKVSDFANRDPIYKKAFSTNKSEWDKASPLLHIKPNNHVPPILFVARENRGRIHDAKRMNRKLHTNGKNSQYYIAKDLSHKEINYLYGEQFFLNYSSKQKQSAIKMTNVIDQFISKQLN